MRFDLEALRPTYELVLGVPGRSYALAIARRLALPEEVLKRAEALLPEGEAGGPSGEARRPSAWPWRRSGSA